MAVANTSLTLKTGDLAYWDSFAGLVPCRVISVTGISGPAGSDQSVTVRLTAARGPYRPGEEHTDFGFGVVPRGAILRNRWQSRISPYAVQCDPVTP